MLLGSIFPAKLIFQDGNYRTSALNPALALISQKNKGLRNEKAEDIAIPCLWLPQINQDSLSLQENFNLFYDLLEEGGE